MSDEIKILDAFARTDRDEGSGAGGRQWQRIGLGFVNRDESIDVILDCLPLNGRFQIRKRSARLTEEAATRGAAPAADPTESKTCTREGCGKVVNGAAFERNQGVCNDCRANRT